MKRCERNGGSAKGKLKFRDAGEAARFVQPGKRMGFYRCSKCGFFHLTKKRRVA